MKLIFYCILFSILSVQSFAQVSFTMNRHIRFKRFDDDSTNLSLNGDYTLIEDSCAQIIRYTHFDFGIRHFFGKFKDVSKANPGLVIAEGNYTLDGLKNGDFVAYYLNGNLEGKGAFTDNQYTGKWEFYYSNGKPELTFEAVDGNINIIDEWDSNGKKLVDNGNGYYKSKSGFTGWEGKLVNGKPDGTWKFILTNNPKDEPITTEHFKKGQFIKGQSRIGEYTDVSHIVLVSPDKLTLTNAEKMRISPALCTVAGGVATALQRVNAHYSFGVSAFSEEIKRVLGLYFDTVNIPVTYKDEIDVDGVVSDKGAITNLQTHSTKDFTRGVLMHLRDLPLLEPATINGKPVPQKIKIIVQFENGYYKFNYKFLPLD